MLQKSQKYSTCVSHVRARPMQSRADQCQRRAGEDVLGLAAELGWIRSKTGSGQAEQSQGVAHAQFRLIFGIRDEQGRGKMRVMKVSWQDQGSPRTDRAGTGLRCLGKEWSKGQKNQDRSKSGKSRTGSGQQQAEQWSKQI